MFVEAVKKSCGNYLIRLTFSIGDCRSVIETCWLANFIISLNLNYGRSCSVFTPKVDCVDVEQVLAFLL